MRNREDSRVRSFFDWLGSLSEEALVALLAIGTVFAIGVVALIAVSDSNEAEEKHDAKVAIEVAKCEELEGKLLCSCLDTVVEAFNEDSTFGRQTELSGQAILCWGKFEPHEAPSKEKSGFFKRNAKKAAGGTLKWLGEQVAD